MPTLTRRRHLLASAAATAAAAGMPAATIENGETDDFLDDAAVLGREL